MKLIELAQAIEPWAPLILAIYWIKTGDRAVYLGFDCKKDWIRKTPLKIIIPMLFIGILLLIGYSTYLNHWA